MLTDLKIYRQSYEVYNQLKNLITDKKLSLDIYINNDTDVAKLIATEIKQITTLYNRYGTSKLYEKITKYPLKNSKINFFLNSISTFSFQISLAKEYNE